MPDLDTSKLLSVLSEMPRELLEGGVPTFIEHEGKNIRKC